MYASGFNQSSWNKNEVSRVIFNGGSQIFQNYIGLVLHRSVFGPVLSYV